MAKKVDDAGVRVGTRKYLAGAVAAGGKSRETKHLPPSETGFSAVAPETRKRRAKAK